MPRSTADELWLQAKALRSLASALVGDQNADDLVQEAALQGLRLRSPLHVSLRAWLGGVLRHLAGKHHRATVLRQRYESSASSPATAMSPDRLAEHREMLQRVTAALTALPEPYQATLLMRFFEDLPPSAIAECSCVPLATVKSRLQRGLAMLRERLDAVGSRKDWRSAMSAAFGLDRLAQAGLAAATTGVLLMGTGVKLALGGTAAVLAVAGLWFFSVREPQVPPGTNDAQVAQTQAPISGALPNDTAVTDRRELPGADESAADTVIRGRCTDEQGLPLAGCVVALQGKARANHDVDFAPELGRWLTTHPGFRWHDREAVTGADGCFAFALGWTPLHFEVTARADRTAPKLTSRLGTLQRGETRDLGDVKLRTRCWLRCRVTDADGTPVVLPWLNVTPEESQSPSRTLEPDHYQVDVGADGTYAAWVLPGKYRVAPYGRKITSGEQFVIPPAATSFDVAIVVVAVAAAHTITGIVVDERELPQAGLHVYGLGNGSAWARTDERGAFTLYRPDDRSVEVEIIVLHEDSTWYCAAAASARWGSRDVRLVLRATLAVEVRVTAALDGRPVADFALHLRKQPGNPTRYLDDDLAWQTGDHHEDGIACLTGLAPGEHVLDVLPVRTDLAPSLGVPVTFTAVGSQRIEVALLAGASRTLRVESAARTPLPGTNVELIDAPGHEVTTESVTVPVADWLPSSGRARRLQQGATDGRGELLLHGARGQRYVLRLSGKGHPSMVVPDVDLDPDAPLMVTLPRGARLEGTLGPADLVRELRAACDEGVSGTAPVREPPGFRLLGRTPQDDTLPRRREPAALVRADGTFVIDHVPAGTWQLALEPWSFDRTGKRGLPQPVATVELREGETTKVAVELPEWRPGVVEGQVLWNGAVLPEQQAALLIQYRDSTGAPQQRFEQVRTDRNGRFSVRTRAGSAILSLTRRRQTAWHALWSQQVTVASGSVTAAVFQIESGLLRLRLLGRDGKPVAGVPLTLLCEGEYESAWARANTLASDAEGWIECEGETRELSVQVLPQRLLSDEGKRMLMEQIREGGDPDYTRKHRLTIGKVLPRRGETVTAELQLPPDWYR